MVIVLSDQFDADDYHSVQPDFNAHASTSLAISEEVPMQIFNLNVSSTSASLAIPQSEEECLLKMFMLRHFRLFEDKLLPLVRKKISHSLRNKIADIARQSNLQNETYKSKENITDPLPPILPDNISVPERALNKTTEASLSVARTENDLDTNFENPSKQEQSGNVWNFLLGSDNPLSFLRLLSPVVNNFFSKTFPSEEILSPSIINLNNGTEKKGVLSGSLFSIYNRSDSLIKLSDIIGESPEALDTIRTLVLEAIHHSISNQHAKFDEEYRQNIEEQKHEIGVNRLAYETRNITKTIIYFHDEIWMKNETLRREWRERYKLKRRFKQTEN